MITSNRLIATLVAFALLLLASPVAPAQDGGGGGGAEEEFDMQKALREINEAMRKAEESLIESIRTGRGASEDGERAQKKIEELLKSQQQSGATIIKKINEIIKNAPRSGGGGGSGGMPPPDGGDPKGRERDDRNVTDRDPRNGEKGGKDPKDGEDDERDPTKEEGTPPPKDPKEKAKIDLAKEWLAQLPPTLRKRVLNGDFEEIPDKYRPIIEAYFKKLAEMDK